MGIIKHRSTQNQSITTLPLSPDEERHSRMVRYAVTMGIRMVCIVLLLFVHGWWLLVCAVGAIVLPYFAMIAANVHGGQQSGATVLRPGALAVLPPATTPPSAQSTAAPGEPVSDAPTPGDDR